MTPREIIGRVDRSVRLAVAFLTIVPVPLGAKEVSDAELAGSRFAFPVVGALLGLVLGGLSWGLTRAGIAPGIAAIILVSVGVALTGALHLDGLADTADGIFLAGGAERRLAVMKDPHVGSFGTLALVLAILGKYAALSELEGAARSWALFGAMVIARTLVLVSAGMAGYARPEGTGRILVEGTTLRDAIGAMSLILLVGLAVAGSMGLLLAGLVLALCWVVTRLAVARLGGVTGDTLGAVVELGEVAFLAGAATFPHHS